MIAGIVAAQRGAATGGDPLWANVVALLRFGGANGSTSFTDEKGHTFNPVGNAQISTAHGSPYATSMILDGVGDFLTSANVADWSFGTGDFCAEAILRQNAGTQTGDKGLFCVAINGGLSVGLQGGKLFCGPVDVSYGPIASTAIAVDTYTHVAAWRTGGTVRVAHGGVILASAADTYNYAQGVLGIGASSSNGYSTNTANLAGFIGVARLTKGASRYGTANFTPPTSFPNS